MPPVQDVATFLAMRDQGLPLLDVRSPGEFAFAHIPGALNLPLFTDEERAKVGTAHARSGREGAVHLALELVGGHLAALLARARHLCGGKREVLLHCWRGGMRSDSMRWLLETGGFTGWAMRTIWLLDTPTNLFPSIHCFVSWLGTRYIYECRSLRHRGLTCTLCTVGSVLVFLATMFTKQHVFYDVIGGVAVAEIGWLVARYTGLPRLFERLNGRFLRTKLAQMI